MQRLIACAVGAVLMLLPGAGMAQREPAQRTTTAPNEPPVDESLTQFSRAVKLQAFPRQIVQFGRLVQSTAEATRRAQAIGNHISADVLHGADPLIDDLDDVQWDGARFLASFTSAQKSGLKGLTKKIRRTNNELRRQSKALAAARAAANENEIVAVSIELQATLAKIQLEQREVAREMGIPESAQE